MTPRILILEITLKGVTPPVWRIVEVSRNSTLHELHAAIQVAMGWNNAHLYSFNKGDGKNKMQFMLPEYDDSVELFTGNNSRKFKLKDIFRKVGDSIEYVYDWGDDWRHEVIFKGTTFENANFGFPRCSTGSRCCPPEDVGGPPGYQTLLKAIETRDKKLLKEYDAWLGYRFDPDRFSVYDQMIFFGKMASGIAKLP
ncbi:MAG TPA: plasmid pRiA4b ORF-3 family protein [Bacteroidia bacterium]|nr:plasmid pRiA4b ORF-3 family protein [Bacteroidia bacterium]